MSDSPFALPSFVLSVLRQYPCRHCKRKYRKSKTVAAGVRLTLEGDPALAVEVVCAACGKPSSIAFAGWKLNRRLWAGQLAKWIAERKPYAALPDDDTNDNGGISNPDEPENTETERPEFNAMPVNVLNIMDVTSGNMDHADGAPIVILTLARGGYIEPLAFPLAEARFVVAKLLIALATYNDAFAQKLLDDNFPANDHDEFIWPRAPYDLY